MLKRAHPKFSCPTYQPTDGAAYRRAQYQYATTSEPETRMSPGLIIRPIPGDAHANIALALRYARDAGCKVAVRTGGHAYTGSSSTTPDNIQIDMSQAYPEWFYDGDAGTIRCGVSRTLLDFKRRLAQHRRPDGTPDPLFMPSGQCYSVHLGGHCQTGGSGQLSRAFGLLADHVISADIITADGEARTIGPDSADADDRALFWAIFGGGPGNFAILTHITFRPLREADYPHARSFRRVLPYDARFDSDTLARLIEIVTEFRDAPQDYDLCVTAGSAELGFAKHHTGLSNRDAYMSTFHAPEKKWFSGNVTPPAAGIAIFFQYSNLDGRPDSYDPSWCEKIRAALALSKKGTMPHEFKKWVAQRMSQRNPLFPGAQNYEDNETRPLSESILKLWTFEGTREYNHPYIKNDAISRQETQPGFSDWATRMLNELFEGGKDGLMASMQMQQFGGPDSKVVKDQKLGRTSFQWRDGIVVGMNAFYDASVEGARQKAEAWQRRVDEEGTGNAPGYISPKMYRWFAYPTGPQNMDEVWPAYFTEEDYRKCCTIKKRVDPEDLFSAHPLAIRGK